jgi:hypothetical protein
MYPTTFFLDRSDIGVSRVRLVVLVVARGEA